MQLTRLFFLSILMHKWVWKIHLTHTSDVERRQELQRYYDRRSRQIEDDESRQIWLARRRANYARQKQQTLGGDITLVGSPTNLNEDVGHSNSTSSRVSLIPPNHEATPICHLMHICNLVRNMPDERNAMQETNGEIIIFYLLKNIDRLDYGYFGENIN